MNALRRFLTTAPRRALGVSRGFPVAPFRDLDGNEQRRQTWELGVLEFEGGGTGVYQWPAGSDRGNLWEVVGSAGAFMGNDLLRFDGPDGRRRRVPIETITEEAPDGKRVLVAARLAAGGGHETVEWENPYRTYGTPGADDAARADVYAGFHERVLKGAPDAAPSPANTWPLSPPADSRFYGPENARVDQALLMAIRGSADQESVWVDLPLSDTAPVVFEQRLLEEFQRTYGAPPFEDPERLLSTLFPRRGLRQTVH
jgi:hypothetical protein